jgi:hypothetical protein
MLLTNPFKFWLKPVPLLHGVYGDIRQRMSKRYASELETKLKVFRDNVKTKKTLFLTMITTYGVKRNDYYTNLVQNEVTMDALFKTN